MWTPNEDSLVELISFLKTSQISDNSIQKEIYKVCINKIKK